MYIYLVYDRGCKGKIWLTELKNITSQLSGGGFNLRTTEALKLITKLTKIHGVHHSIGLGSLHSTSFTPIRFVAHCENYTYISHEYIFPIIRYLFMRNYY